VARELVDPAEMPRILVLDDPGSELVSFRLSVPMPPRVDVATASPVLRRMAEARMAGPAANLGARVEAGSTAQALTYTVTGALADLDHLAFLLRQATRAPRADEGFRSVRNEVEARLTRLGETGAGRLEAQLRATASPGEPSVSDVRGRIRSFGFGDLLRVWEETHVPDRMMLVVGGDVSMPVLLAAVAGLGDPGEPGPMEAPPAPSPPVRDRPDLLRGWFGAAWRLPRRLSPPAAVAAVLASRHLEAQRDDFEAYVRLWEGREGDLLAVFGTAYNRGDAAMRGSIRSLPSELAEGLDDREVAVVARRLALNLLAQARTPWGRVNAVGRFLDAGMEPDAAARWIAEVQSLNAASLRSWLAGTMQNGGATAEAGR
jgi:predicted Zn-dependent peptidase